MIEKLTVTRISATDKKKDGSELIGKYGKFWRVGLQVKEYGDKWLNGFTSKEPTWVENDVIEVDIKTEMWQRDDGTEVEQLKFRVPNKEDLKDAEIAELKAKLNGQTDEDTPPEAPIKSDEITPDDIQL